MPITIKVEKVRNVNISLAATLSRYTEMEDNPCNTRDSKLIFDSPEFRLLRLMGVVLYGILAFMTPPE